MREYHPDPRVKLALLLCISAATVATRDLSKLAWLLGFTLLAAWLFGVTVSAAWRQIHGIIKLIASIVILQCVFERSGEPLISLGGVSIVTVGGVRGAAFTALRLLIVVAAALVLLTTASRDYLVVLHQMHVPYEISFMMLLALRFLPLFREEATDVLYAVQMRGVDFKGMGFPQRIKAYSMILVPILSGVIHRTERVALAMEARGFRAKPKRTCMRRLELRKLDWLLMAVAMLVPAAVLVFG